MEDSIHFHKMEKLECIIVYRHLLSVCLSGPPLRATPTFTVNVQVSVMVEFLWSRNQLCETAEEASSGSRQLVQMNTPGEV